LIAAMARNDGSQCGFCALGMVLAAKAFLARNLNPDEAQIAAGLGGKPKPLWRIRAHS
jgi:aerobic-type carbon monoxide dehydrogenase small subunit (CoxS/CutS family)